MLVRFSIANLGLIMTVPCGEIDSRHAITILNSGSYKKGKLLLQPIGGAVQLTPFGRNQLIDLFGAKDFHKDDARFVADDKYLKDVFRFFTHRNPVCFEIDPLREVREELSTSEFPANEFFPEEIPVILSPEEVAGFRVEFKETFIQPFSNAVGESTLAREDTPSRRLFHLFEVEVPTREIFEKILASKAIRELSEAEVASTNRGANKGENRDGITIADNVVLY